MKLSTLYPSYRRGNALALVLLVAVSLIFLCGYASAQDFDGESLSIMMETNKAIGAGFGHLPVDSVDVEVKLFPPGELRFSDSLADDPSGKMIWIPDKIMGADGKMKWNEGNNGEVIWNGAGMAEGAARATHAVRFYGDLKRLNTTEKEGAVKREVSASIVELDADADTTNRNSDTRRPPVHTALEDEVEAVGGMILPVLHNAQSFPDELTPPNGPDYYGESIDFSFRLQTSWKEKNSTVIGKMRCTCPLGVALYRNTPTRDKIANGVWFDVLGSTVEDFTGFLLTNQKFVHAGFIKVDFRWEDEIRQGNANMNEEAKSKGPFGSQDWIRVVPEGGQPRFIRQKDNVAIPSAETGGPDACHMVSKHVTNSNLPTIATFDGPPGDSPDLDTFRVELRDLPADLDPAPKVRIDVLRGASQERVYSKEFGTVAGSGADASVYRMNKHIRLVATGADDAAIPDQTPRVRLGDTVVATTTSNAGGRVIRLHVARPYNEDGPKAVRTVDVRFLVLSGVNPSAINIDKAIQWTSDVWAQSAIRFNVLAPSAEVRFKTITPVKNILTVDRAATGVEGKVDFKIRTSENPETYETFSVEFKANDNEGVIAQKLVDAISGRPMFTASKQGLVNESFAGYLVLVNKGENVHFQIDHVTPGTNVSVSIPTLDFPITADGAYNQISRAALGANFKDDTDQSIDIFVLGDAAPTPAIGNVGVSMASSPWPSICNTIWVKKDVVVPDSAGTLLNAAATEDAFTLAHEIGHVLFNDPGNDHVDEATNLMLAAGGVVDEVGASKRLTDEQNTRARSQHEAGGPGIGDLLQKKW